MKLPSGRVAQSLGLFLCRVLVPLWVLSGAFFKLMAISPRTLPKETILNFANRAEIDLYVLLAVILTLEFFAASVMLFVAKLARPMAIVMLSSFLLVLIGEMSLGNLTSCGCLGTFSPPPWAMMVIDVLMLAGVIVFRPKPIEKASRWGIPAAVLATLIGGAASFGRIIPAGRPAPAPPETMPDPGNGETPVPDVPEGVNPTPAALPGFWFAQDVDKWAGKPWREIELFKYMKRWPKDIDGELRYVVFYGRTCDHCEDMFHFDLTEPGLASQVTAVEVPVAADRMRPESPDAIWVMPDTEVEHLQLPVGCDWIMTTPLALRIENGIVTCAQEGEHAECLGLE